jgi:acetolactate synthase-1/2/3 large subunit
VHSSRSAEALSDDTVEAIAAALTPPGRVATLIVPSDCQWNPAKAIASPRPVPQRVVVDGVVVEQTAKLLRDGTSTTILLGGQALSENGLRAAARVAAKSGCRLMSETFAARIERGTGIPAPVRLPYFPEQALQTLAGTKTIILAGAKLPVAFFGYQGLPSQLVPEGCQVEVLARPEEDVAAALAALAAALGAAESVAVAPAKLPALPSGKLDPASLGAALANLQPDGAIIIDESATSGGPYVTMAPAALPHTCLALTGGAIGQGLPTAIGAAIACPDRRVIAFQADGSSLYTIQSLWTMAREGLNITTLLCSNRAYRILKMEAARSGNVEPGRNARSLTELAQPVIEWTALARGFGVSAVKVDTADDLTKQLERAFGESGPNLIEVTL